MEPVLFPKGRPQSTQVHMLDDLYLAGAKDILGIVAEEGGRCSEVLVVGHNPGIENLAAKLAGEGSDEAALATMKDKFPTCGLASIAFDAEAWSEIRQGKGRLLQFLVPRELD